jgi:hypothetical protein
MQFLEHYTAQGSHKSGVENSVRSLLFVAYRSLLPQALTPSRPLLGIGLQLYQIGEEEQDLRSNTIDGGGGALRSANTPYIWRFCVTPEELNWQLTVGSRSISMFE